MRRLKSRGLDYDLEFIQEALDLFCRYGFAQTKCFNGHMTLYEHRHLGQHHDHLICTRCGRVEEFINPIIEQLQSAAARDKGFVPLDHRMDIYGLCQDCAMSRGRAVPLSEAEKGEHMVVCGHVGGEELQRRLTDMGLCNGAEIEILGSGHGPVVVACRGSRLALGQGMCDKVMVTPAEKTGKIKTSTQMAGIQKKKIVRTIEGFNRDSITNPGHVRAGICFKGRTSKMIRP